MMSIIDLINDYKEQSTLELKELYAFTVERKKYLEKQKKLYKYINDIIQIGKNIQECDECSTCLDLEIEKRERELVEPNENREYPF
jgi:hypothetical protein